MYQKSAFKKNPSIYIRRYEFEVQYLTEVLHLPAHVRPQFMGNPLS